MRTLRTACPGATEHLDHDAALLARPLNEADRAQNPVVEESSLEGSEESSLESSLEGSPRLTRGILVGGEDQKPGTVPVFPRRRKYIFVRLRRGVVLFGFLGFS